MYKGELHCRTVFSFLFVELHWSLFYELDFSCSYIGEFIVPCNCFLQAAAVSGRKYFLCPGMKMEFICGDT